MYQNNLQIPPKLEVRAGSWVNDVSGVLLDLPVIANHILCNLCQLYSHDLSRKKKIASYGLSGLLKCPRKLMYVCLCKDAKQYYDTREFGCTATDTIVQSINVGLQYCLPSF